MAKKAAKTADATVTVGGLTMQNLPIALLVPDPANPRVTLKPGDVGYEALAASIERFGLAEPLIYNQRTGYLVGGHQRVEVLKARGVTHVPVSIVDKDPAEALALGLALNKVEGAWDNAKLLDVLQDLSDPALLAATGFTINDLAVLTAELATPIGLPDEAPFEPALQPAVTRSNVTATDVQAAEDAQADRFVAGRGPKDITCPNCAFVFGVGGWLKEYIETTDQLKAEAQK